MLNTGAEETEENRLIQHIDLTLAAIHSDEDPS